jgi:predicted 2-oxoglutarate/Fe(II)-dependent dioxygenase YbiX/peroxiredoxin
MSIRFQVGDPVPWFNVQATTGKRFHFDTAAGRYLVLCFYGSASWPNAKAILQNLVQGLRPYFDDQTLSFFGISTDAADETTPRVQAMLPGIRYFWDFDGAVSRLYGALTADQSPGEDAAGYRGFTLVLDPMLRVLAQVSHQDPVFHHRALRDVLERIAAQRIMMPTHAPVLILPRVFQPEFCRELIALYTAHGGKDSGFMRQMGEKTVSVVNHGFKRREDFSFDMQPELQPLRERVQAMLVRRLIPQIQKMFQFDVSHIERHVVSCYSSETGGFFRPHRDNTTTATAHRRFACTINLNAEEFEGGELRFPEFGPATYRAPTGGAVVFSCSLLHEATPVTSGTRYAFLPFFYNSEDAKIRAANEQFLE